MENQESRYTWDEHPIWTVTDWKYEVANGDTRAGYWQWVDEKVEQHPEDENDLHACPGCGNPTWQPLCLDCEEGEGL